eukprot:Nitzschia sp. Nitz4//scaffold11_size288233//2865//7314//NITZ4_000723-RA/size288233-processed-gene-0.132-mRNA-1//1//CDS//3329533921//3664//frame0
MSSSDKEATNTSSDHAETSHDDLKETGSNTAETWTESSFDEETSLPLLKYSKFLGVPRKPPTSEGSTTAAAGALVSKCTSSAVAQVLIHPASAPTALNATPEGATTNSNVGVPVPSLTQSRGPLSSEEQNLLSSDLWKQPHLIMAAGWSSGKVSLVSVANGLPVAVAGTDTTNPLATTEGMLPIRSGPTADPAPTVDVSFDSSGTTLAAVDSGGTCCIWDFRFSASWKRKPSSAVPSSGSPTRAAATPAATPVPSASGQNSGMFSSFMSALTGMPPSEPSSSSEPVAASSPTETDAGPGDKIPCLAASISQVSRISYPTNWKSPTVVVLDPAHRKRSSKYLVVGFQDGRLMLTKRPGLFQRRSDVTLYQGTGGKEASSYRGVECVAWRGNLIAWADVGGIKVLDAETLTRVAHIDRPTGARAALYPTLTSLSPHLLFETSQSLLVAWGDCLMSMHIQEQLAPAEGTAVGVRRTVECTMAWELAGMVASGVMPLDANHVLVVGVVTPEDIDGDEEVLDSSSPVALDQNASTEQNELEIQIISRHDGTVQYADVLPMESISSAADFRLLSSFALQRMDNSSEWEEYSNWAGIAGEFDDFDLTLLASPSGDSVRDSSSTGDVGGGGNAGQLNSSTTFVDSHLQWDLKSSLFEGVDEVEEGVQEEVDDSASVDSDDYGFVLRPLVPKDELSYSNVSVLPPEMILTTPNDVLHMSLFTVDDAVEHALVAQNRPAMALQRALMHRRQLRRFNISDLVQSYLEAVLQLSPEYNYGEKLSLRRMKLAIQAMPVILGGHTDLWTKWVEQLEKLPGALFILRSYLPVRDPILPASLYENVLRGMLDELGKFQSDSTEGEKVIEDTMGKLELQQEAAGHFLESILGWGPTKGLKEFIKLYQYSRRRGDKSVSELLRRLELLLRRRYLQTSACYLQFPVAEEHSLLASNAPQYNALKDDSQDALFEVSKFLQFVSGPLTQEAGTLSKTEQHIYLEAFARLKVMQGQYEVALQAYLYMGVSFSPLPLEELESWAIDTVQAGEETLPRRSIQINGTQYDFVLGLVENQHLHRLLLDSGFLARSTPELRALQVSPLFALLQLVGLDRVGDFLVEHCVSTERSDQFGSQLDRESSETIPIDLVAKQLKSSPPLMYWYLNLLFMRRQELYVKFPRNSIPPASVTELHRQHFQLLIDFAGDYKDSVKALAGTETYKIESKATPLLSFLKAALPLGGISPIDARRELETIRSEDVDPNEGGGVDFVSSSFALELAYIIEHYTDLNEAEAIAVLYMYLKGTNSIMLGVAYAQRQREYSSMLWDKMIEFCLTPGESKVRASNGMLFGELLEAAALSGADLARTVSNIPPGMVVEGLRPRLVAAVADYRLKLGIHQAAAAAAEEEKVSLLRETAHRSRRGARFEFHAVSYGPSSLGSDTRVENRGKETNKDEPFILSRTLRPIQRKDRRTLSYSLPMR